MTRIGCACLVALLLTLSPLAQAPRSTVIDSARLLGDLKVLSADDMQGRRTGTPGSDKARAFIVQRFKASGILPFGSSYEQSFALEGRAKGINVVGQVHGRNPSRKYIVISAHYDHLGVSRGVVYNGADDNASGTAALFAIAEYFKTRTPNNSLIFAAFDAEESGLRGSQAFVQSPPVDVRSLALNLNLDMIGRAPDRKLFVVGTRARPGLRSVITSVAPKSAISLLIGHDDPSKGEDWTRDSDHYSFMRANIPALYFGVEDFDHHHEATDDYATISHDFYVRAVETLILVIEQFDANLEKI
jgi:Zn-dependent M28 family amino/carboxypeptidase